jgi:hypothetical protein
MRALAAAWPDASVVQRSAAQLPWRHHQYLLDKLDDQPTREWYAAAAIDQGWSRDVLALHIQTRLHERSNLAQATICWPIPTTSPPSACCCARPRMMSWPSTRCEGMPDRRRRVDDPNHRRPASGTRRDLPSIETLEAELSVVDE